MTGKANGEVSEKERFQTCAFFCFGNRFIHLVLFLYHPAAKLCVSHIDAASGRVNSED